MALKRWNNSTSQWELVSAKGQEITVSSTAPASPDVGDIWIDPDEYQTLPSSNSFVSNEVPTGAVNGTNTTYVTGSNYIAGSLEVYINGLKQASAHVTETTPSSGTFDLDVAPATGDVIDCTYQVAADPYSGNADTLDGQHAPSGTIVGTTDTQTLTNKTIAHDSNLFAPVAFKSDRTTALSIPNVTFTKVTYNNKSFDTHSAYSTATGIFTAPYTGYYTINARITIDSLAADSRAILSLYKNGTEFERLYMIVAGTQLADATLTGTTLSFLTTGDTIEVYAWQGSGSSKGIEVVAHYSEFSAYLVGRTA